MFALLFLFNIYCTDSQTRASHSMSVFAGRLLVIRAEKTNDAAAAVLYLRRNYVFSSRFIVYQIFPAKTSTSSEIQDSPGCYIVLSPHCICHVNVLHSSVILHLII